MQTNSATTAFNDPLLYRDWRRLSLESSNYFSDVDWFRHYVHFGCDDPSAVRFVSVRDSDGMVLGIVPLEERTEYIRRIPVRVWSLIGSQNTDVMRLASSADFLCRSADLAAPVLQETIRHLAKLEKGPSLLQLGRFVADSMTDIACRHGTGRVHYYSHGQTNGFDTGRSFADLYASLSAKFKANLRNLSNRALREGVVSMALTEAGDKGFAHAFDEFLRVEASGWKATAPGGVALATNPNRSQHDFLCAIFSQVTGYQPQVFRLLLDGETVAALLAVRYANCIAVPKIGFDVAFRKIGPGHLLVKALLEHACADTQVSWIDFVGDADWYKPWQPRAHSHHWCYKPIHPIRSALPMALLKLPSLSKRR